MPKRKPIISKIGEASFDVYIRIAGRRIRRRFSSRTCKGIDPEKAAHKFADEMSRVAGLYDNTHPTVEIDSYFTEYLRRVEAEKSKRTIEKDRGRLRIFGQWASSKRLEFLSDISPAVMDAFKAWYLKNRGRNPNNYISIIQAVMNRAVTDGILPRNPLAGYKKVKPLKDESLKFFTTAETRRIMKALPRPFPYNFFTLLLHTGMRIDELINLELRNIDLERAMITVESQEHHPTKNRKTRHVPLTDQAEKTIKSLVGTRDEKERYLFDKGEGLPLYRYNWYARYFKDLCELAEIPKEKRTLHTFRHTFATKLLTAGVKMYVVSDILGHSDYRTTLRVYGHLDPEYRNEIKKLSF